MDRRTFHRLCGGLLGGAAVLHRELAAAGEKVATEAPQPRSRLVHGDETPLTLADLAPGDAWIFHYPYRTTPCFLVRLGDETRDGEGWPGGLDEDGSVVAFSAICSHKMTHPARPISHIAYRADPVEFVDRDGVRRTRAGLISCCSERSVYDPADGARVLSGPAPQPLAAIRLALDGDGTIAATASVGRDRYEDFLDAFGFRLALEHGQSDVRRRAGASVVAIPATEFSRQQIRC